MARLKGRFINGEWVYYDPREGLEERVKQPVGVMVFGDIIDPTVHHGTGRVFDSRSKFKNETKALGLREGTATRDTRKSEYNSKEAVLKEWNRYEWKN
jgi:hypothetical protein